MVTKIESNNDQFLANINGETYVMDADASLVTAGADHGIFAPGNAGGRTFRINGTIDAAQSGIFLDTNPALGPDKIIIGVTGTVGGDANGIAIDGGTTTIRNGGRIQSAEAGVFVAAAESLKLTNSGTIESVASEALAIQAVSTTLINTGTIVSIDGIGLVATENFDIRNDGTISGGTNGIEFGFELSSGTLINRSVIAGIDNAIFGVGTGDDGNFYKIVNRGHMIGSIDMDGSDGNDVFDNAGGRVSGDIFGGEGNNKFLLNKGSIISGEVFGGNGNDTYTIDRPNVEILEFAAGGSDTFRSSISIDLEDFANMENVFLLGKKNLDARGDVGVNILTGNAGNNELKGLGGDDTLRGGRGDDRYDLGDGSDTIIFKPGDGRDLVVDFVTEGGETDIIDLSAFKNVKNFNDLINNHVDEQGDDIVIDLGGGDEITLREKEVDQLGPTHFQF